MGFGPRGTCGQKRLGASRRRGHLNCSTVHQGPFASLSVFPPVCSPRRPAVPRNSSPGSEEEDTTPVLGPRDPPESRRCPPLSLLLSHAPLSTTVCSASAPPFSGQTPALATLSPVTGTLQGLLQGGSALFPSPWWLSLGPRQ